jgi:hypothetical protein
MLIETPSAARFGAGYREAATRPESSITLHVGQSVRAFAFLVPAFTLLLSVLVLLASEVSGSMRCSRGSAGLGTCVIDRQYVLSNAGTRVPLENMKGATLYRAKSDGLYEVRLLTKLNDVSLGEWRTSNADGPHAAVHRITHFLMDRDQTELSIDLPTGFAARALGLAALFGLSLVVAAAIFSFEQRARVVLSEHHGAIRVEQRHFFFGRKTQSWPLESLVDAEMEEHRKTYRVKLVFKGNLAAPVIARFHRNEARHALVIDAIHEFLRRETRITADVGAVI